MRFSRSLALASVLALGLAAAACGDDSDDTNGDDTETPAPTAPPETGEGAAVHIMSPSDGEEVSGHDLTFELHAEGIDIQPVDDWDGEEEGVGHYHILLNQGCYEVGEPIPTEAEDQGIYHFGTGTTEPVIEHLEPGEYEVCVHVADQNHVGLDITEEIALTVIEEEGDDHGDE